MDKYDNVINKGEQENSFEKANANVKGTKDKTNATHEPESKEDYEPQRPAPKVEEKKETKKKSSKDNSTSDNEILTELFPESGKAESFRSHSVYLKDSHWKKIQKIAKDQNISNSSVITKILDKVL